MVLSFKAVSYFLFLCISLCLLFTPSMSHEGPHEKMTMEDVKQKFEDFRQGNVIEDDEHIREHLESIANIPEEKMTLQQKHLHYFYLHDTDRDNRIDGLEIVKAIFHNTGSLESFEAESVIPMIDNIMKDRDKNNDGYLDYYEYRLLQAPSEANQ